MNKQVWMSLFFILLSACASNKDRFAEFNNQSEERIFSAAEHALAKGNDTEAIKNFEALDAEYPFGRHSEQAKLDIIYAYYQHEDLPAAAQAAERFIQLYPRAEHVDYAYYMKGLIHFETGWNWTQRRLPYNRAQHDIVLFQQAFNNFKDLIHLFPRSVYGADARQRMIYIRNILAQNELEIATFYMRKKAYSAAKERAVFVIEKYQGAPQVKEALKLLEAAIPTSKRWLNEAR